MATYKVIQDIESEDKLLGPLTLRQFIYAAMVAVMGFVAFKLAAVNFLFIIPFVLPMAFFGLLAAPFGHDQSSEVWLLAKIGFLLKPRKRIWDQTGLKQLVTITAPKRMEEHLSDGLTQTEVKSRLQALANTIDSRGWAVKNVNVNLYNQPAFAAAGANPDRLVDTNVILPQTAADDYAADDILDPVSNPTAQALDTMINQSTQAHRQAAVSSAQSGKPVAQAPADYWFLGSPSQPTNLKPGQALFDDGRTIQPGADLATNVASDTGEAEKKLLAQIHEEKSKPSPVYGHMRVIDPAGAKKKHTDKTKHKPKPTQTTQSQNPALIRLAGNDDLNVATIAREADKATKLPNGPDDEVVISLR